MKNAHHILNFSENDNIKYDINNGMLLCDKCHHIKYKGSFHNIYVTHSNTPEQLEEYINIRREMLGVPILFSMMSYLNGNILRPDDVENSKLGIWIFNIEFPPEKFA